MKFFKAVIVKGAKEREISPEQLMELMVSYGIAGTNVSGSTGGEVIWLRSRKNPMRLHALLVRRVEAWEVA